MTMDAPEGLINMNLDGTRHSKNRAMRRGVDDNVYFLG